MLWFAWKIVLLQYRKQPTHSGGRMISSCDLLEKSYFCSIANNKQKSQCAILELWFAWKIVLLQYRKQPPYALLFCFVRCDLLEKSYFCSIANNIREKIINRMVVVICLKNRTFAVSQTTRWQHPHPNTSCDLLEKSYFCSIANNICLNLHK